MGPPGCNDREMKRYKSKAKGAGKATGTVMGVDVEYEVKGRRDCLRIFSN